MVLRCLVKSKSHTNTGIHGVSPKSSIIEICEQSLAVSRELQLDTIISYSVTWVKKERSLFWSHCGLYHVVSTTFELQLSAASVTGNLTILFVLFKEINFRQHRNLNATNAYPQLHTSTRPGKLCTIDPITNITCLQTTRVRREWYTWVDRRRSSVTQDFGWFCLKLIFFNNNWYTLILSYSNLTTSPEWHQLWSQQSLNVLRTTHRYK